MNYEFLIMNYPPSPLLSHFTKICNPVADFFAYLCTRMQKKLHLFSLWAATLLMLLTTVVTHHHHEDFVCIASDAPSACTGDAESEGATHAEHRHTDRETCRIHQLHHFIISKSQQKSEDSHATHLSPSILFAMPQHPAVLPQTANDTPCRHFLQPMLPQGASHALSKRGPPSVG